MSMGKGRITIGLYNSYNPKQFQEPHRRAIARAGGHDTVGQADHHLQDALDDQRDDHGLQHGVGEGLAAVIKLRFGFDDPLDDIDHGITSFRNS